MERARRGPAVHREAPFPRSPPPGEKSCGRALSASVRSSAMPALCWVSALSSGSFDLQASDTARHGTASSAGTSSDPSTTVNIRWTAPALLRELREIAVRLQGQSTHLAARAIEARAMASSIQGESRAHREERRQWQAIVARMPADADHIIVLCAYCHRARGTAGWTVVPAGIERELKRWVGARVSHGYCPDCVRQHALA